MSIEILVIGGSKFIGKHLVLELAKNNNHKITVINRGKSNPNIESEFPSNVVVKKADRRKSDELREVIGTKSFDYVFDVVLIYGEDAESIISILQGKVKKRYIYISSASVYDGAGNPEAILTLPVFEDDPIGPTTDDQHWYLKEKRLCEEQLLEAHKKGDFPLSIVRPTYVYGPDNYIYREAYFFDKISHDEILLLPKDTDDVLCDFVHVDDVVSISIACMDNENALGSTYNATSGEAVTPTLLANLVGKALNKTPKIMYYSKKDLKAVDWPDKSPPPYPFTDEGKLILSILKSANELNFTPKFRFLDGLKNAFEWYTKQTGLKFMKPDPEKEKELIQQIKSN